MCYSVHYVMHYVCITLYVTLYVVVCIDRSLEYDDTKKGSLLYSLMSPQLVWNLSFILNIPALKHAFKSKCMTLGLHRGIKASPSPSVFRRLTFERQEAVMSPSPASLPHPLRLTLTLATEGLYKRPLANVSHRRASYPQRTSTRRNRDL